MQREEDRSRNGSSSMLWFVGGQQKKPSRHGVSALAPGGVY